MTYAGYGAARLSRLSEFQAANCEVLVMSTDSVYSHRAFAKASK
jgi:alkyl hydroperoxide reductase subunit AhpC